MRLLAVLIIGVAAGLLYSTGIPTRWSLQSVSHLAPLGLRSTALIAFGLTMAVLVSLTLVSEGGFRKGELSTAVPSFFAFYAFFFGMTYWLFA